MLEALTEAVDTLEVPVDGVAIAAGLALRDRLEAALVEALGAFDAAELWDLDAATSLTAWLRDQGGMTTGDAYRWSRAARRLASLPFTAAAYGEGSLSGGQVRAVLENLTDASISVFAEHEAELVPLLVPLSTSETVTAMRHWATCAANAGGDPGGESEPGDTEPRRSLNCSEVLDGRRILDGDLDADSGEVVAAALRLAESPDVTGEPARTPATRRADALTDICRYFLDHQQDKAGGRHRPHVNVIVRLEDLYARDSGARGGGTYADGVPTEPATLQTLLCDSALHWVLVTGRSSILDYGTATRSFPVNLWNALVVRDRHCRFPGCDRASPMCHGHHVVPFEQRGPTRLANCVLLCHRHHRVIHRRGWTTELRADGDFVVTDPRSVARTSRPPPAAGFEAPLHFAA